MSRPCFRAPLEALARLSASLLLSALGISGAAADDLDPGGRYLPLPPELAHLEPEGLGAALCTDGCAAVLGAGAPRESRCRLPSGVELRALELGDPAGAPVLFLHGYTDSSRSFLPAMERLARLRPELRLIALDLRGHGGSTLPPAQACRAEPGRCFGLDDLTADVLAYADQAGLGRFDLVGHSLGSLVAQEIALARPERVGRLVLIGSTAALLDNPVFYGFIVDGLVEGPWRAALAERGLRFPDDAYQLTPLDADPRAAAWLAANWSTEPGGDPEHLAAIARDAAAMPLAAWIGVPRAARGHDRRAALARLATPTLVLWGAQDPMFAEAPDQSDLRAALAASPAACASWFKAYGRPLAAGETRPELGHNAHWGAPDAFAADLAAFLRDGGRPTRDLPAVDPATGRTETLRGAAPVLALGGPECTG